MKSLAVSIAAVMALGLQVIAGENAIVESKVRIGILNLENIGNDKGLSEKASSALSEIIKEIGFYEIYNQEMLNDGLKKVHEQLPLIVEIRDVFLILENQLE